MWGMFCGFNNLCYLCIIVRWRNGRRIDSVKLAENEVTNMNEWFKCNNEQPTEITGSNPVLTTSV